MQSGGRPAQHRMILPLPVPPTQRLHFSSVENGVSHVAMIHYFSKNIMSMSLHSYKQIIEYINKCQEKRQICRDKFQII